MNFLLQNCYSYAFIHIRIALLICLLSHVIGFCLRGATESLPRQLTLARKRNNYNGIWLEVKHSKSIWQHFIILYDHLKCMQPQRVQNKQVKLKKKITEVFFCYGFCLSFLLIVKKSFILYDWKKILLKYALIWLCTNESFWKALCSLGIKTLITCDLVLHGGDI